MGGIRTFRAGRTALVLPLGCVMFPAWASPPTAHPPHLDLRPPVLHELGGASPDMGVMPHELHGMQHAYGAPPAGAGDRLSGRPRVPASRDTDIPALGAGSGGSRVMSPAESFARRFHREGLPVARLWENRSALVSLGLNGKGKPGLWLVQKTH